MKHFLAGKALTSLAGLSTLLLVIRGLPVEEFAAYSILLGTVDLLIVATGVGTSQILTRFIPEAYALHYTYALRRILGYAFALRFSLLVVALALVALAIQPLAAWIGLGSFVAAAKLYLFVILFRTASYTMFQVLEAMLHQATGQGAFALGTMVRLIAIGYLYLTDRLSLEAVIAAEIASEVLASLMMALGIVRAFTPVVSAPGRHALEFRWLKENRRRMFDFGAKGYLQVLIIMPFSGMMNRIVVGAHLSSPLVALFGFAQSIFDTMQRFLPAQLFAGMVRPVLAARFAGGSRFGEVEVVSNLVLKINLLLIGATTVTVAAGGGAMLDSLTQGKYGGDGLWLVLLMLLLITLESWRHILDQICHTVERYGFLVFSNGVLGSSLLLGLSLIDKYGIYALPAGNCVGLLIANQMVAWWLRRTGYRFRLDWAAAAIILFATTAAVVAGVLAGHWGVSWPGRIVAGLAVYGLGLLALLRPTPDEIRAFAFLGRGREAS